MASFRAAVTPDDPLRPAVRLFTAPKRRGHDITTCESLPSASQLSRIVAMKTWFNTGTGQANDQSGQLHGEQWSRQHRDLLAHSSSTPAITPPGQFRLQPTSSPTYPAAKKQPEAAQYPRLSNRFCLKYGSHTKQLIKLLLPGARIAHSDPHPIANWRSVGPALSFLLLQQLFCFAAAIPVNVQNSVAALDTTVCELADDPGQFDGKLVRVKVHILSAFTSHDIEDVDNRCPNKIRLSYATLAKPASSSPASAVTPTSALPGSALKKDDELYKKFLGARMYPTREGMRCSPCNRYEITATVTGTVHFPARAPHVFDGPPYVRMFFLESIADVKTRDLAATYDPRLYSTEPVIYPRAYLSGKLLALDGNPLAQTNVQISSADASSSKHGAQQKTDDQGQFTFAVPPGPYVLAINLYTGPSSDLPYDITYYPGTTGIASAKVFPLNVDQHVDNVTFSLAAAKPLQERKFSGKVVWPDGRVAADAFVWLTEAKMRDGLLFRGPSTRSDAGGNFDFAGFRGKDYFLHAKVVVEHKPVCAQKVRVNSTALSDAMNLKLTVEGLIPCIQQ